MATAYSLFIVGSTSLAGVFPKYKQGLVNLKTALIFGVPAIVAVYAIRRLIVPAIPDEFFTIADFVVTKSILMMLLFAVLMVFTSYSMIKGKKENENGNEAEQTYNYPMILQEGAVVGILTGLVGAGWFSHHPCFGSFQQTSHETGSGHFAAHHCS